MVFKFYANENLALTLTEELRQQGHDVLTSYEAGNANQGIPDEQVLAYATTQQRAIITFNRDNFIKLHRARIRHSGIIICKDDRRYIEQAQFLHHYLTEQTTLTNRLIRVQKQNQPKSSQPVFVIREY